MNTKVAIIGNGWVGKAMRDLFPEAYVYVRSTERPFNVPYATNSKEDINKCDIAFICVPTPNAKICDCSCHHDPMTIISGCAPKDDGTCAKCDFLYASVIGDGKLDTSIVEEVIAWCECPLIVIRSTVNPGDCNAWEERFGKAIIMQPEYLGETVNHPLLDEKRRKFLVIGGLPYQRKKLIDLYTEVYNANVLIRQVTNYEAEVIKLSENRAIAFKVAQCQELYDVCEKAGVDYYTVRDAVYGDDPRFNLWWTMIYPEKRGFNSKCIPKDIYAWAAWAESLGYNPVITREILEKNKEWIK